MKQLEKWFFTFWIENYKVSFLFLFLIVIAGVLSMLQIPKESSPDIKFGIIAISTPYSWVNPGDIDSLITEKIEKEIEDIDGISKISSTSRVWLSSVTVELENGVETRDIMTDIKDRIDRISFPSDVDDTIVQEISTRNELLFEALIYSDERLDNFTLNTKARTIQNALEGKYWIAEINIWSAWNNPTWGSLWDASDYDIKVLISKEKLELLKLSVANISSILRSYNKNTPLGNYEVWDLNYDFRFDGEFSSIDDLKNTIISWNGSSIVRLKDVSTIVREYDEDVIKTLWFYNEVWKSYVTLSFNKTAWDSVFTISKSAKVALEEFLNSEPWFENINVAYSQDLWEVIIEDYRNLGQTALQTIVLVFLTIFVFVGLRESLIASILLPLAFFITFIVLNTLWYSLNFLTNFSLVLTLGIAIDTIIVIIEWAAERQKLWYSRKNAVILAVRDLKSPLISGTTTTLVAFLPMIFLPGILGKFLSYIPITVFITLLAALILSLTLATALFYRLSSKKKIFHSDEKLEETLSPEELEFLTQQREWKTQVSEDKLTYRDKFLDFLGTHYYNILLKFLHSRKSRLLAIFVPFVLLILSFVFLSPRIWFTLFPASDEGAININIEWQVGSNKESLTEYIPLIEETLSNFEETKVYYVSVSWNSISVYIELTDAKVRERAGLLNVFMVEEEILEWLSPLLSEWLVVEIAAIENGPPAGSPVWIKLNANSSNNIETLKNVADDFKKFLQNTPGTKNASISSSNNPGQFVFTFDRNKLSFSWLTPDDILWEVRFYLAWVNAGSLASTFEDNDIILSIQEFEQSITPANIMDLIISTKIWDVRVGDYASFAFEPGLSSISREDGKITISANSDLEQWIIPTEIQPKLIEFAESYSFPDWISYSAGGENEENAELIQSTLQSFFIAIFLIFTILVFQFNSYSQPIIILYSVVLALLWVNIWLFVTGNPYSMTFGIGFIALTWVVVNDAIILVDRINRNLDRLVRNAWDKKLELEDYVQSLVAAGKSRLQPIIVTTLTTLFGVLPLALQDAFWAWLGYTLIFWLFAGSFMTLFVIPALYYSIYLHKKMR
jgi:multidrug efflux pump subunit AcrB